MRDHERSLFPRARSAFVIPVLGNGYHQQTPCQLVVFATPPHMFLPAQSSLTLVPPYSGIEPGGSFGQTHPLVGATASMPLSDQSSRPWFPPIGHSNGLLNSSMAFPDSTEVYYPHPSSQHFENDGVFPSLYTN